MSTNTDKPILKTTTILPGEEIHEVGANVGDAVVIARGGLSNNTGDYESLCFSKGERCFDCPVLSCRFRKEGE